MKIRLSRFAPAGWTALVLLLILLDGCGRLPAQQPKTPVIFPTDSEGALSGGMFSAPDVDTAVPTFPPTATSYPTATPETVLDPDCLVGTWQVVSLPQTMAASLAGSGSSLELEQVEGKALYAFEANGTMQIRYQQVTATLNGELDGQQVQVAQSLDGSGTAQYAVNAIAGEIILSNFGGEGIHSALSINGQELADGSLPVWRAFSTQQTDSQAVTPSLEVETARVAVQCAGDVLILQPLEPSLGPHIHLERVSGS